MKSLLLITILTLSSNCYNVCSIIKFSDYSFDLSALGSETIQLQGVSGLVKFANCVPDTCKNSNYNSITTTANTQASYLLQINNAVCYPMTINATILSNFVYIDSKAPEKGIQINYLPYITTQSITQNNNTYTLQTTYQAVLSVFCNSATQAPSLCTLTTGPKVNSTKNGLPFTSQTIQINCKKYSSSGCPSLTLNNFYTFLINNKIWFVIILWVISIFQLFFGYFVIRLTILIYGTMTGAILSIIFSAQNYEDFFYDTNSNGIIAFIVILSFFLGLMFGIVLLTLPKLGYMNIGFWNAIIFSLLLQNSALYATGTMVGFYISLGVMGFIMAAISLLGFRKFIIVSTSFISSFWIVRTLGFVLPYYPNQFTATKLFVINQTTPWQFYLYLLSIIIVTVLGCTFQFCWYKKQGKDQGNKGYYLEDDDSLQNKLRKLLQFDDIKKMISAGKEQVMFLKNLVANRQSEQQTEKQEKKVKEGKPKFIQMTKMSKIKSQLKRGNDRKQDGSEDDAKEQARLKKTANKDQYKKEVLNQSFSQEEKPIQQKNKPKSKGGKSNPKLSSAKLVSSDQDEDVNEKTKNQKKSSKIDENSKSKNKNSVFIYSSNEGKVKKSGPIKSNQKNQIDESFNSDDKQDDDEQFKKVAIKGKKPKK